MTGVRLSRPRPELEACIVVPARDEERLIGRCIGALAAQRGIAAARFECLLVLDGCTDQTRARALEAAVAAADLALHLVEIPGRGAASARRIGMDLALERLEALGREHALIATTDADTAVEPEWLAAQLSAIAEGAELVGGERIVEAPLGARGGDARRERFSPRPEARGAVASLGLTAAAYRELRGPQAHGIDPAALVRRAVRAGRTVARPSSVRVRALPGAHGRDRSSDGALAAWLERRSYGPSSLGPEELASRKSATVSVVVPAREVAGTIGGIVATLRRFLDAGAIDELVVVDAASPDGTADVARRAGARVLQESELLAEFGPCRGKGDAMWRALTATSGEIVVYIDGDTEDFHERFLTGMLEPMFADPTLQLIKGAFARPFRAGDQLVPHGGGRVTELMARPLLNLHRPELAGFWQPLAGEVAARRPLLEALQIPVGYGVEIAMMIDAADLVGVDAMAQADLGTRQNRHQSLRSLSAMAYAVLVAASRRLHGEQAVTALAPGRLVLPLGDDVDVRQVAVDERPPVRDLMPTRLGPAEWAGGH